MKGWDKPPFLIAHRGYSAAAPENTLAAFESALAVGAEVLECDVQRTSDGVVVVLHDPTVDRTTDGRGPVRCLSWRQVRGLDAGYPRLFGDSFAGERVPRLEELLQLARGRAQVFVEIKPEVVGSQDNGIEAGIMEAARSTGMLDQLGVLSFSPRALERVRGLEARLPLGLVFRWWRRRRLVEETIAIGADYLVGYAARLRTDPETIEVAHERGLRVGAYVVDSPELMLELLSLGVDGIATNRVGDLLPGLAGGTR